MVVDIHKRYSTHLAVDFDPLNKIQWKSETRIAMPMASAHLRHIIDCRTEIVENDCLINIEQLIHQ